MLDIDYFKQINDSYGHNTGDMALKSVAAVIYEHIRSSDYVFRYGGEEFMILLVESEVSQASIILETLRKRLPTCAWRPRRRNPSRLPSVLVSPNMTTIRTTNSWWIKPTAHCIWQKPWP